MRGTAGKAMGIGAVALAVGGAVLGASVYRAVTTPLPEEAVVPIQIEVESGDAPVIAGEGEMVGETDRVSLGDQPVGGFAPPPARGTPESALAQAVEHDLFRPERAPLNERYRLPSEIVPVQEPEERERPRFPDLRVHGTARAGEMGIALIRLEDRDEDDAIPPTILALGESIAGYALLSVTDEEATLVGPAGTMTLPVTPLPTPQPSRRDRERNAQSEAEQAREQAQQARQQLERVLQQLGGRAGGRGGRGGQFIVAPEAAAGSIGGITIRTTTGRGGRGGGG